jgi:ATP-dependent Clp protease ATP-binding subunit ClpA
MAPIDERVYLTEFLTNSATKTLVSAFQAAIGLAEPARTETQLAHIVLSLLEDPTVSERITSDVNSRTRAALAQQIIELPTSELRAGNLGFKLAPLVEPARELARDWGASLVSPLTFLATCLSAEVPLDPASSRTREALRSAGLTLESLGVKIIESDARRQDFTFKSLEFGLDLTAQARAGVWETSPLIGMESELVTLVKLLGTGSVCVVGEPGIGKSALLEGLAWRIAQKDRNLIPPSMDSWTIVSIQSIDVLQGMSVQGQLEERIQKMITFFVRNPTVIPFFDEIHRLLDSSDPASKVIATALKPPMARGLFRCVGCTTDKEYARYIADDEPMKTRLPRLLLREPDKETAKKIIEGSKSGLLPKRARELGIDISPEAINASINITSTYKRSDRLPRKAIRLIQNVVTEKVYELEMARSVDVSRAIDAADVARVFSEAESIPVDALDTDRPAYYSRLRAALEQRVKGQPQAISPIISRLALHSRGWVNPKRPRGRFLFLGPPGVGKTELALSLADEVMRDHGSMIAMSMADFQGEGARNKFMGADPGYKGFGETPTVYSRVMMRPFSVVVLDEFEKSHPSLANPLLSVLDGWGEDSQGRQVDFSQCIFVMTSNAVVGDPQSEIAIEFAQRLRTIEETKDQQVCARLREAIDSDLRQHLAALNGIWTLPLLDRIDRICLFGPLNGKALAEILNSMIDTLRVQSAGPLPPELDDDAVRLEILTKATAGEESPSARRLERALLRWLGLRAELAGPEAAAMAGH